MIRIELLSTTILKQIYSLFSNSINNIDLTEDYIFCEFNNGYYIKNYK